LWGEPVAMPPVRQKSDASCAGLYQQRRDTTAGDGVEAAGMRARFPVESRGAARDLSPGLNANYVEG
jgi:hypothetical protein